MPVRVLVPFRVRVLRTVLALGLLVAGWGIAVPVRADTLHGVVIVVIDGDTVLFKPDHYSVRSRLHPSGRAFLKIRLADIDAPEKAQPYGEAATRALTDLLLKQRVELDVVATDVYGRSIAQVQKGALQVNTEMVRLGLAWTSMRYRRNAELAAAQDEARRMQRGVWADAAPTPPWEWRRAHDAVVN